MQCDYNNFWRHGKTERNQCADALGDIKVAVSFLVQSTVFGVCVFGGTDSKEGVLTAMCMTANREWDGLPSSSSYRTVLYPFSVLRSPHRQSRGRPCRVGLPDARCGAPSSQIVSDG